jgi:hypothetical protein
MASRSCEFNLFDSPLSDRKYRPGQSQVAARQDECRFQAQLFCDLPESAPMHPGVLLCSFLGDRPS